MVYRTSRTACERLGWRGQLSHDDSRVPVLPVDDLDALDGRGLRLLDLLSSGWGVRPDPPGKVGWFELDPEAIVE